MGFVPPEGPEDAAICVLGEAPGRVELQTGRPFSGPSGDQLNDILRQCGLTRSQIRISNVIKDSDRTPSDDDILGALPGLTRELCSLPKCNVFIPVGGVALRALSAWRYTSITRMRGSLLETFFGAKMVPTLHPAWYMRGEWRYKPVVIADFRRAVAEASTPLLTRPPRKFIIEPTFEQAVGTMRDYQAAAQLSVDIETFGPHIACVGFARSANEALCVPIMRSGRVPYWGSLEQEIVIWREIDALLRSPSRKIFQNGMFDIAKLAEVGVEVR